MTRSPGQWPTPSGDKEADADPEVAAYLRRQAERARFQLTLGSIRADLEAEPSPVCVRAAARRWHDAITQITDDVIKQLRSTG